MSTFEITKDFLLDKQPFQILSGAIHYFRIPPEDWEHSLYNLKALGFNTVETYVPWNLHEPKEGQFDFSGQLDIERFLALAQELGLYAIVRPSPYICAEWEFGGLPAWLLTKKCRVRSLDSAYLAAVASYYKHLLPRLARWQLHCGGNILMFQLENEYGSFGENKEYLLTLRDFMRSEGISMPLFTSDGSWMEALTAGSLIDEGILVTGNFGSKSKENFMALEAFMKKHHRCWPLMCMEFWVGWFNRWREPIIRRDTPELVAEIISAMQLGSINLYMFHGGTNFGFMNGCSARQQQDLPQVTSYDYGALLDEQGNPTERYTQLYQAIHKAFPSLKQETPRYKSSLPPRRLRLQAKTSLFANIHNLSSPVVTKEPQTMESLGQNVGYLLYRKEVTHYGERGRLRIIDAFDRVQVYMSEKHLATQYQAEIGRDIVYTPTKPKEYLDILVENLGRVNYGPKLWASSQSKGIQTGVMSDLHFLEGWTQYPLPLSSVKSLDFTQEWQKNQPAFYLFELELEEVADCFLDLRGFGKGCVWVNDHHLGKFWEVGPIYSLYLPQAFLTVGKNQLIIFETEGRFQEFLCLRNKALVD